MKAYIVQATRRELVPGGEVVRQVPSFHLLADVEGIVSVDHARRIAHQVLGSGVVGLTVLEVDLPQR